MLGVADALNVTFGDVLIVNLFFEITPFCTSIMSQSAATGNIYHARNMDFGLAMPELSASLRDVAVDVDVDFDVDVDVDFHVNVHVEVHKIGLCRGGSRLPLVQ